MKLIIDVPEYPYEQIKNGKGEEYEIPNWLGYSIYKGTPLDTVKAEIADLPTDVFEIHKLKSRVLYMLDNIGKESEEE